MNRDLILVLGLSILLVFASGTVVAAEDSDNDGLNNTEEEYYGSDPHIKDTDGDGINDGREINRYDTDPTMKDTDEDGLSDYEEIHEYGTDPLDPDTNQNGIFDGRDVRKSTETSENVGGIVHPLVGAVLLSLVGGAVFAAYRKK